MNEDKNKMNKEKAWWQPVMIFYVKTISWIMIPLIIGIMFGNYVEQNTQSQTLFFTSIMLGFGVTCYGIYREIKEYRKKIDKEDKK